MRVKTTTTTNKQTNKMSQFCFCSYFMYNVSPDDIEIKISVENAKKLNLLSETISQDYIDCRICISADIENDNEIINAELFYKNKKIIIKNFDFKSEICDTIKNALNEYKDYEGNKKYIKIINDCKDEDIYYYQYNKYEYEE